MENQKSQIVNHFQKRTIIIGKASRRDKALEQAGNWN